MRRKVSLKSEKFEIVIGAQGKYFGNLWSILILNKNTNPSITFVSYHGHKSFVFKMLVKKLLAAKITGVLKGQNQK